MSRIALWLAVSALSIGFATPTLAVDGVVLITQARALSGNVTPGDAAGFPVTLSQAGSYRMASNLIPGANNIGIEVAAPDVTIDFNGFVLSGGPAGGTNNSTTGVWGKGDRLTVQNGKINSFEVAGIDAISSDYLIVENMRVINNTGFGIYNNGGNFARIQNSTIATNVLTGIDCGDFCHIEGNVVSGNGNGIFLTSGTVLGNTIQGNSGLGIVNSFGLDVGFGNNTLVGNRAPQVKNASAMHPNFCSPAC